MNRYSFLTDTYATERQKTLGVWAMFQDSDMSWRPEARGRSVLEQMVHQCVSEDYWMKTFLGIEVMRLPPASGSRNCNRCRNRGSKRTGHFST